MCCMSKNYIECAGLLHKLMPSRIVRIWFTTLQLHFAEHINQASQVVNRITCNIDEVHGSSFGTNSIVVCMYSWLKCSLDERCGRLYIISTIESN